MADENVAAKHGNGTADFLLVLGNIVSTSFGSVVKYEWKDEGEGNREVYRVCSRLPYWRSETIE